MLAKVARLMAISILARKLAARAYRPVQVLLYPHPSGFRADIPRLPYVTVTGVTIAETLDHTRSVIKAYRAYHRTDLPDSTVDLAFIAREVTPQHERELRVFMPLEQPPMPPDVEAWAFDVINELRDSGRVVAYNR